MRLCGARRGLCVATLVAYASLLVPPPLLAASSAESSSSSNWLLGFPKRFMRRIVKPKRKLASPEELQQIIDGVQHETFNDNEARRDEKADITLPAKRVALNLLDGQIGTVRQFLAFQATTVLKGVKSVAANSAAWEKSRQVVGRMGSHPARVLNTSLSRSSFGKTIYASVARNKGAMLTFARREGNFILMAFISTLICYGIYDGADIDTLKDRVVSVAPLCTDYRWDKQLPIQFVQDFLNRELSKGFGGHFDKLYQKALRSQSTWGKALAGLDQKAYAAGQRLYASSSAGQVGTKSFAQKIGLVGVGEGAAFSLGGLYRSVAVGASYGVAGQFIIDAAGALVQPEFQDRVMLGGNRNEGFYTRQDLESFQYQKTGKETKDGWRVRWIRFRDAMHHRAKWPIQSLLAPISMFTGGYVGSVVAGALPFLAGGGFITIVGGTLVSTLFAGIGTFVGSWAAVKLDRSKFVLKVRRMGYARRIRREIEQMPCYRSGEVTEERAKEIARARAQDFEKIETIGQVGLRILIVDSGENIRLVREGGYTKMVIDDEHGSRFHKNAEIRFDILDLEGNRFLYDIHTDEVRCVGKVSDNNGRRICFVHSAGVYVEDDVLVNHGPEDPERTLFVYSNALILERQGEEWVVRAHGANTDVFLRESQERFAFEDGLFKRAKGPGDVSSAPVAAGPEPLAAFESSAEDSSGGALSQLLTQSLGKLVEGMRTSAFGHIDACDDLPALVSRLDEVSGDLGLDGGQNGGAEGSLLGDVDTIRNLLKARMERLLERAVERVEKDLSAIDTETLRSSFYETLERYPLTPSNRLAALGERLRNVPVWGAISALGDVDVALALAVTGTLLQ